MTREEITIYKNEQKIEKKDSIKNITNDIKENSYSYNGVITEINSNNIVFENHPNILYFFIKAEKRRRGEGGVPNFLKQ